MEKLFFSDSFVTFYSRNNSKNAYQPARITFDLRIKAMGVGMSLNPLWNKWVIKAAGFLLWTHL